MTSISKYEADFADNVIRAEGVKLVSNKPWTVKRKCHQFALKENTPGDSSSSAVQLIAGKTVTQERLYGPATLLDSRTIVYTCHLFKCIIPCACKICQKLPFKCRVPSSCCCSECLEHFKDHNNYHATYHFSCKHCFQLVNIFPCFSFFFLEQKKSCDKRFKITWRTSETKPIVKTAEPKKDYWDSIAEASMRGMKRKRDPWSEIYCTECEFSCLSAAQLKEHIELNHLLYNKLFSHVYIDSENGDNSLRFKCYQCSSFYSSTKELNRHIDGVHYEEYHQCKMCPQIFTRKDNLSRHVSLIHSNDTTEVACDLCDKLYKTWGDRMRHRSAIHSGSSKFSCGTCGRVFNRKSNLTRHMASGDSQPPVSCTQCDKRFCYEKDLKKHVVSVHNRTECDECGMSFIKENLRMHKFWAHTGKLRDNNKNLCDDRTGETEVNKNGDIEEEPKVEKLIDKELGVHNCECTECGQTFNCQDSLVKHRISKHSLADGVIFRCENCGCTFNQLKNLNRHKQTSMKYYCSQCDHKFCTGKQLKTHQNANHNNISCTVCGKHFSLKSSLQKHIRQRVLVRCKECDKCFCYERNLNIHIKNVHSSIPCGICGQLVKKEKMDIHMSWSHNEIKK